MFLSDKIINLGKKADFNDLSQAKQAQEIIDLLHKEVDKGLDKKKMINIMKFSIKELNKLGFSYYKFEIFFKTDKR